VTLVIVKRNSANYHKICSWFLGLFEGLWRLCCPSFAPYGVWNIHRTGYEEHSLTWYVAKVWSFYRV